MSFDLDPLEPRRLCSITWANRGNADRFDQYFGRADATLARQLVNAAIADWNAALPKANLKVTISAANLEPRAKKPTLLGLTRGTNVSLDSNAANRKWYFDPDLNDDADAVARQADFDIHAPVNYPADFYTAVLHELGHALGFSDPKNAAYVKNGPKETRDPTHTNHPDLMAPNYALGFARAYVTPYDASHTRWYKSGTGNPARGAYFAAESYHGMMRISPPRFPADPSDSVAVYRVPADQPDAAPALVATFTRTQRNTVFDAAAVAGVTYRYSAVVTRTVAGRRVTFVPPNAQTLSLTPGVDIATSMAAFSGHALSTLSWTPYPGADHYEIYRTGEAPTSVDEFTSYLDAGYAHLLGTVPGSETTFADPRPSDIPIIYARDDSFRYWVVAYLPGGPGGTLVPLTYPDSVIGFPNLRLGVVGNGSVSTPGTPGVPTLRWSPFSGLDYLDHIDIWRAPYDYTNVTDRHAAGATLVASLPNTASSFTDPTATPDTPYRYWVVLWAHTYYYLDLHPTPGPLLPFPTLDFTISHTQP